MAGLKIATVNVEGLHNFDKREGIFKALLKEKFEIIALQETHITSSVKDERNCFKFM